MSQKTKKPDDSDWNHRARIRRIGATTAAKPQARLLMVPPMQGEFHCRTGYTGRGGSGKRKVKPLREWVAHAKARRR